MAKQLIKVRPTKIELIKLRRRLKLAQRIQKIVKDRLSILIMEFLQIARDTIKAKVKSQEDFAQAYKALSLAGGYHGFIALDKEFTASEGNPGIVTGSRNVAGVKIPSVELKLEENGDRPGYSFADTSAWVDRSSDEFKKCLDTIVQLAELQTSLEILGREINRTKRIVNALEYMIIPSLENTISFLEQKFEERDREEKARMKRVKTILAQKELAQRAIEAQKAAAAR
jgi:V/A-type H+/Na+-transporting ATPase subunit D